MEKPALSTMDTTSLHNTPERQNLLSGESKPLFTSRDLPITSIQPGEIASLGKVWEAIVHEKDALNAQTSNQLLVPSQMSEGSGDSQQIKRNEIVFNGGTQGSPEEAYFLEAKDNQSYADIPQRRIQQPEEREDYIKSNSGSEIQYSKVESTPSLVLSAIR